MKRYALAVYLSCCVPLLPADAQPNVELDQLRRSIAEIESGWQRCSVEIIETKWPEPSDQIPSEQITSSCRSYILLDDCFREQKLGYPEVDGQPAPYRIRQWDGRLETDVIPQRLVERRDRPTDSPPPSLPYGVLLDTIGVEGDLAQFLDANAKTGVEFELELLEVDAGRVGVRRRSRLPAAEVWDVIEIQLDAASDFEPMSLRRYRQPIAGMVSRSRQTSDEASEVQSLATSATTAMFSEKTKVEVIRCESDHSTLRYDIRIDVTDSDSEATAAIRTQRIRASKLGDGVQFSDVRIMELMGNPTMRTYLTGSERTEQPFYPVDSPAEAAWPAIDRWMLINNILMWSLLSVWLIRFVFKWVSSKLKRARPTVNSFNA